MKLYFILLGIVLVNAAPSPSSSLNGSNVTTNFNGRIVGGEKFAIELAPYQVSISTYGIHSCGGTIIGRDVVITAAHCMISSPLQSFIINAGTADTRKMKSIHTIVAVEFYRDFDMNEKGVPKHDIVVLKVTPPFKYSRKIRPIDLAQRKPKDGELVTITGYGATKERGRLGFELHAISLPVSNRNLCGKSYKDIGNENEGPQYFCAGHSHGMQDSCQGDSGGPAVINGKLIGLVSHGRGCARPNTPGIYTDISFYYDWLQEFL